MKKATHRSTNPAGVHFYEAPQIVKLIEPKNRMAAVRNGGRTNNEMLINGYKTSVMQNE